jgi:splicing factor 3B subunit 3
MDQNNKTKVIGMSISLFDTLPVANSLNVSKLGLLFVAAEFGNHGLYRFERIDVEGNVPTCTSGENIKVYDMAQKNNKVGFNSYSFLINNLNASKIACSFTPSTLRNLHRVYSMDSLAPITGVLVGELAGNEVSPQIYTLNGRGPQSSIRILRHGMAVTELAVSDLPGVPGNVFTIRDNSQETLDMKQIVDKYIIVSFADATLALSVDETVEEVGEDSHFVTDAPTLACSALGIGGIVQVHPDGVRLIKDGKASEWKCPGLKRIENASANESQVMITFAGGDIVYFEVDVVNGNLQERTTKNMGVDVSCLDVGTVKSGWS